MAVSQISIAAATAVVGYDLLQDTLFQQAQRNRTIRRAGLAGSAAALDTIVDLYVGTQLVARLYNTATGAVLVDAHMFDINAPVPAGAKIIARVVDAPGTNPINLALDIVP